MNSVSGTPAAIQTLTPNEDGMYYTGSTTVAGNCLLVHVHSVKGGVEVEELGASEELREILVTLQWHHPKETRTLRRTLSGEGNLPRRRRTRTGK